MSLVEFAHSIPTWFHWVIGVWMTAYFLWAGFTINRRRTNTGRSWTQFILAPPKKEILFAAFAAGIGIGWSVPWAVLRPLDLWPILLFSLLMVVTSFLLISQKQGGEGDG